MYVYNRNTVFRQVQALQTQLHAIDAFYYAIKVAACKQTRPSWRSPRSDTAPVSCQANANADVLRVIGACGFGFEYVVVRVGAWGIFRANGREDMGVLGRGN
jgi:hypothetical protein